MDVGPQTESSRAFNHRCRTTLAVAEGFLHRGLVRSRSDGLHIQPKKEVAHGRVAGDGDFVDLLAPEAELFAHIGNVVIDRSCDRLLQLAVVRAPVVGDPIHHIGATEALRVLKSHHRQTVSG